MAVMAGLGDTEEKANDQQNKEDPQDPSQQQ